MTKILHLSAHLRCRADKAFEMFTVSKLLESWLVKPYSEGGHAEVDPVLGGKYELFWDPASRDDNSTVGCKITAIAPDMLLAFDWKGPAEYKRFMNAGPLTHVVVSLFSKGNGSTNVHLVHSGWGESSEWEEARNYFQQAWRSAFQKLEKAVND